jgi:hypothetical protein
MITAESLRCAVSLIRSQWTYAAADRLTWRAAWSLLNQQTKNVLVFIMQQAKYNSWLTLTFTNTQTLNIIAV